MPRPNRADRGAGLALAAVLALYAVALTLAAWAAARS